MKVLYLQYTSPANYPPLEHSGLIFLKADWEVHYFGIRSEGASSKLAFPEALAARQTIWSSRGGGFRQKLHFFGFTLWALVMALRGRWPWVYCSDLMSCPAAWLIRHFSRCRVVYHEHDSPEDGTWSAVPGTPPPPLRVSRVHRLLLWTRQRVGRDADLVVLPNPRRLALFNQLVGRTGPSLCVYNCPRQSEVLPARPPAGADGILRLAFHGSINLDRLPLALLAAMSRFPGRVHLSVIGYETVGSKGYMAQFLYAADRLGLAGQVVFMGVTANRRELLAQAATCDVGLAFMPVQGGDVNMANMAGASNKPFDYLACGLALLVSARPEWEEMFVHPGLGLACLPDDADSLAVQLGWFLDHPVATREMGERGRQRILAEWNYETQFAPVLCQLK